MDGETLDVEPGSFDAAISRLGLMYLPDKAAALAEARAALRPGGRYAAIVFAEPERNRFFSVPIAIIRRRAELPPPAPGLPGPFSCVDPRRAARGGRLRRGRGAPGRGAAPAWRAPPSARGSSASRSARCTRCSPALTEAEREEAWGEVEEALREFEGPAGFVGPCELLVGVGHALTLVRTARAASAAPADFRPSCT